MASQASHERDVLLRNNGHGGFDEVSGTAGLDVDQDGRSFAVLDVDGDGDADVVLMSPRSSPQLRLFRNDFASGNGALAVRLTGTKSNRDAIGARVTVETDRGPRHANGHRGIRLHLAALEGAAVRSRQEHPDRQDHGAVAVRRNADAARHGNQPAPLDYRRQRRPRLEPLRKAVAPTAPAVPRRLTSIPGREDVWLYQPYPAPDFTLRDLAGQEHSLSAQAGHPVALLFWATTAPSRAAARCAGPPERSPERSGCACARDFRRPGIARARCALRPRAPACQSPSPAATSRAHERPLRSGLRFWRPGHPSSPRDSRRLTSPRRGVPRDARPGPRGVLLSPPRSRSVKSGAGIWLIQPGPPLCSGLEARGGSIESRHGRG